MLEKNTFGFSLIDANWRTGDTQNINAVVLYCMKFEFTLIK